MAAPSNELVVERYEVVLDVRDVRIGALSDLVERLQELARVEPNLLWASGVDGVKVPVELKVTYDVGPGGAAADLWELRDVVEGVNEWLGEFTSNRLGKPALVQEIEKRKRTEES